MSVSKPFTYNSNQKISETEKFVDLNVGFPKYASESTGLQRWNGPDEEFGYVIEQTNIYHFDIMSNNEIDFGDNEIFPNNSKHSFAGYYE